jgi:DNA repair exonuclease SbcCD ATPase subunit
MRLRRIEIRGFRKLGGPILLDRLGDGLTVVSGPNEEGKSTVLAALKAAFFERHDVGGAIREAMTPLGRQDVPEVAVELELGGAAYRLRKAFRRGGVSLDTPQGRLTDDAAEHKLLDLLRFERRQGRSEVKPQHLGLQALFWVDQGTSFAGFESLAGGRERIASAIEAEVGSIVTGDRGRRLLDAVEKECRQHWTQTWRETGKLKEKGERVAALDRQCQELEIRRKAYDAAVDKLAALRDERRRFIARDELGRAKDALDRARQEVAAVERLEGERARARSAAEAREAEWRRLDEAAARRRKLGENAATAAGEIAAAERERNAVAAAREVAEAQAATAVSAEREAVEALVAIEVALDHARRRVELGEAEGRRERLAGLHAATGEAAETVRRLKAALAANPATAERLAAVRKVQAEKSVAAAALAAVATRLDFAPRPGAGVRVGGRPHDPAEPLRLAERTELELEPFGRLVVSPGGGDVEQRRKALAGADEALGRALRELAVGDLAAAEALFGERNRLEAELNGQELWVRHLLEAERFQTIEALAQAVAEAAAKAAALRSALGDEAPATGDPAELEARRRALGQARELAGEATRQAALRAAKERERLAAHEARLEGLRRNAEALARQLAEAEAQQPDDALARALAEAATAKAQADGRLVELGRQLEAVNPGLARDRLAQAERRLRELEGERLRLDRDVDGLEGELRGMGADAVGERLAEIAGALALARAERARLLREASAWRLLHDELSTATSAAQGALLAPIRERVRPWLARLFPEAELVLDAERLEPTHLRRDGQDEPFASLSVGTREQLAVLVRLALARLLLEREGEAPCLILDDALVYADEARFEIMKTILEQAAKELQILVLTCRPRDYLGLAARHLRLEECRLAAG